MSFFVVVAFMISFSISTFTFTLSFSLDMEVRRRKEPAMGVTRNLTEVFTLLRSNAQQNKFIYMNSSMPSTNRSKNIAGMCFAFTLECRVN